MVKMKISKGKFWLYIILAFIIGLIIGYFFGNYILSITGKVVGAAGKPGW